MSLGCSIHPPPTAPRSPKCSRGAPSLLRDPRLPQGALWPRGCPHMLWDYPSQVFPWTPLKAPHTFRAPNLKGCPVSPPICPGVPVYPSTAIRSPYTLRITPILQYSPSYPPYTSIPKMPHLSSMHPPGHLCAPPRAPAWPYGAPGAPNTSRPPPAPPRHWGVHAQAARTPPSPNCTPPSQVLLLPGTAQWAAVRGKLRHRGTFQPECYPTPCLSFSSQGGILSTSLKKLHCHHPNCPSSTVGPQFALPVDFAGKDFIF